LALLLLLQSKGRTTAAALAEELEVSVRTVYRDLQALSTAGVPVFTESGPGGGCHLLQGYRSPLDALTPDEADALLILGVPTALRQLGLADHAEAARRRVNQAAVPRRSARGALVHLDLPRWFQPVEETPHLVELARAARQAQSIRVAYAPNPAGRSRIHRLDPFGLVNKAGVWYLVGRSHRGELVLRVGRIREVQATGETFERPEDFDLESFWSVWSDEFVGSRPSIPVEVRASPEAFEVLPEIFGDAIRPALDVAAPADESGHRVIVLSFERPEVAAYRLVGLAGLIEVLGPPEVRRRIAALSRVALQIYAKRAR
jgi:predicted DNA-binding transcriptional regulator YafY